MKLKFVEKGFTLAETLIVLVILGVIASITIPAVVRNQIEAQNRTKIKKTGFFEKTITVDEKGNEIVQNATLSDEEKSLYGIK